MIGERRGREGRGGQARVGYGTLCKQSGEGMRG